MLTKAVIGISAALCFSVSVVAAADDEHELHHHAPAYFHAFRLEAQAGHGQDEENQHWDFDGWIGNDFHKLWLRSEGERIGGETEQSEFWAMYSYNVGTFWDLQAGVRQDTDPRSTSYAAFGVEGLAPYFFETRAHLFVSDEGDFSARLHQETDILFTQRLILEPYGEINLFGQDVPELNVGAGFSNAELGFMLRYEITRKFSPFLDLRYERTFGETSAIERSENHRVEDVIGSFGLKVLF